MDEASTSLRDKTASDSAVEKLKQTPAVTASEAQPQRDEHQVQDAAHQASTIIEAGDYTSASESGDSTYQSDEDSFASASLSSSVRDFAFENGRRYHRFREGSYLFPNDDQEQDREDMKHAMVVCVMGDKLHFTDIGENPQNIIDLGTGTGMWAIEMGEQYPSASVLGIDLSPIQPTWVPSNVKFMVDDAESPWLHPRDHFDLVHGRHTVQAFKDYLGVFKQAYEHIKPGGYFECHELDYICHTDDDTIPPDYQLGLMLKYVYEGLAAIGPDLHAAQKLPNQMKEAGYVNVKCIVVKVPIGPWAKNGLLKKVGTYFQAVIWDGLQGIALGPMCRGLGWSAGSVEVFLKGVRDSLRDPKIHAYMNMYIISGQKPTI